MIEFEGYPVLDSKIVNVNQHNERHTWLKGHFSDLGEHIQGTQGNETLIKRVAVRPVVIFEVKEPDEEWDEDIDGFQYNPARNLP